MKVKILNIADKEYDVYAPEGKSYRMYQKWCVVDVDGVEKKLMVKTFSQQKDKQGNAITESSVKIFEGAEFDSNVNVMSIEKTRKPDSDYDELAIKAEKKDSGYSGGGKSDFKKLSLEEWLYCIGECEKESDRLGEGPEFKEKYFHTLYEAGLRMVEWKPVTVDDKKLVDETADKIKDNFDGKEVPFSDDDIPF